MQRIEVERDGTTGDVTAVIWFDEPLPDELGYTFALDEGPAEEAALECATRFCVLTLPEALTAGRRSLVLQLVDRSRGTPEPLGPPRTFELAAPAGS